MKPKDSKKVHLGKAEEQFNRLLKIAKSINYKESLTFITKNALAINPVKAELYFDFQ